MYARAAEVEGLGARIAAEELASLPADVAPARDKKEECGGG